MSSGQYTTVLIENIIVNRGERQRRELTGLEELAKSIQTVGLLNAPIITRDLVLVAGERRLTACRDILGWTHVNIHFADQVDPAELQLIELEENLKRAELPWKDQCAAIAEYHRLNNSAGNWSMKQTGEALGFSEDKVRANLHVQEALEEGVDLVAKADKFSVARNIVLRKRERAQTEEQDELNSMWMPAVDATLELTDHEYARSEILTETVDPTAEPLFIHNVSFHDVADNPGEAKFNFLHCDFPYGINAGKHNGGAGDKFGGYDDSEDVYWTLLDTLKHFTHQRVSPSAHMMFWFSMDYYEETRTRLIDMGWVVNPFPLIWYKSDNAGILPDPSRGPRRNYETAFHCIRGDRKIVQAVSNVHAGPVTKSIHMSEKPVEMLKHFFRMYVDESTNMIDPTAGSGNSVAQSILSGARQSVGLELSERYAILANKNVIKLTEDL